MRIVSFFIRPFLLHFCYLLQSCIKMSLSNANLDDKSNINGGDFLVVNVPAFQSDDPSLNAGDICDLFNVRKWD